MRKAGDGQYLFLLSPILVSLVPAMLTDIMVKPLNTGVWTRSPSKSVSTLTLRSPQKLKKLLPLVWSRWNPGIHTYWAHNSYHGATSLAKSFGLNPSPSQMVSYLQLCHSSAASVMTSRNPGQREYEAKMLLFHSLAVFVPTISLSLLGQQVTQVARRIA
jgi:hypothetical protein